MSEPVPIEQNLECSNTECGRYLGKAFGSVVAELKCPGCRATTQFKIIQADRSKDVGYKFLTAPTPPKKKAIEVS